MKMDDKYKEITEFFAETYYYPTDDKDGRNDAKEYLEKWKKNLLYKLSRDTYEAIVLDEQWIDREALYFSCLSQNAALSLKLYVGIRFKNALQL